MAVGKTLVTNEQALPDDINKMAGWGLAAARPATGDVLAGSFYFSTDTNVLEQEQNGSWIAILQTAAIVAGSDAYPAGYHAGNVGGLDAIDTDLAPENIKKDVNIFGKVGTFGDIVQEWGPATRTTQSTSWDLKDETNIPVTSQIIVWAQGYGLVSGSTEGSIQILVDDVQKLYLVYTLSVPGSSDWRYAYGPTTHYKGPGGTVKCEVKTSNDFFFLGGRRGMYSIS